MARVLVIDDDEGQRTLVRAMLNGAGHHVEEASDGAEGLRRFGASKPDLVLTDIHMPGIDGHEVISALKVLHSDVPIVAMSGGSAVPKDELLLQAVALGAREVIQKPFEYQQLLGAVQRALTL